MKILQRIRVPAGLAFTVLFLLQAQPRPRWLFPGLALAALGLVLRVWGAGHLQKGRQLAVSGPYRHIRNPLYSGSFLMVCGFLVAASPPWLWLVFGLLFGVIYLPVVRREEGELRQRFGATFEAYSRAVPGFVPLGRRPLRPPAGSEHGNFRWDLVILNREYRAAAGFLALAIYLVYRSSM